MSLSRPTPAADVAVTIASAAVAGTAILAFLIWVFFSAPSVAAAAGCTNEAIRTEQGQAAMSLPECRAYELVSPDSVPLVQTSGGLGFGARAAGSGDAYAYFSYYPFSQATSSEWFYRASRGEAGWSIESVVPQSLASPGAHGTCEANEPDYSTELSTRVVRVGRNIKQELPEASFCGGPQEELVVGEPRGFSNLLRAGTPGAPLELVNRATSGGSPENAQFQDGSGDLSHVVFGEDAQLTAEAPPGYDLYEWSDGNLRLVTFLPDGSPARGDLAGATSHRTVGGDGLPVAEGGTSIGTATFTNAVSTDGESVFFYVGGNLYLRENASQEPTVDGACSEEEPLGACTIEVDLSRGLGKSGGGIFQFASADGDRVFFTDESELTFPSSAEAGKPDLYEYNVETEELVDLTYDAAEAANVRGFSGASSDGSYLYFVARGALTGADANAHGEIAQARQPNLYLAHEGTLTFIAELESTEDRTAWGAELVPQAGGAPIGASPQGGEVELSTRTSPDGRYFAFNSVRGLTGNAAGTRQIFLFEALTGGLSCASCLPEGASPGGEARLPLPMAAGEGESPGHLQRSLTDRGQLFFTSDQPLVTADTDGTDDVYEFGPGGTRLISDGGGSGPSYFFEASEGGGDVFFATADPLVRSDVDNALNVYDARTGGGFPEPSPPDAPCAAGETCRAAGSGAPQGTSASTSSFTGPGNAVAPKACGRGKVRRHGQCVTKKRQQKKKHPTRKSHGTRSAKHRKRHHQAAPKGEKR